MAELNGKPIDLSREPGSPAYIAVAARVDEAVLETMKAQIVLGGDPGAILAGGCAAIVRCAIALLVGPVTVRAVNVALFPSINAAAESMIRGPSGRLGPLERKD